MRVSALLSIPMLMLLSGEALAQCRVEGVVRSTAGRPLAGATIRIDGPEVKTPLTATAGADGQYAIENVKAGTRVRVSAYHENRPIAEAYALITLWVETIDLQERATPFSPVTTEDLGPSGGPSGEIGGVVRSPDGLPVPGARITVNNTTFVATTDSAGRFVIGSLRAGIGLELHVSAPGFKTVTRDVVVPIGDRLGVDLQLEASPPATQWGAGWSGPDPLAEGGRVAASPEQVAGFPGLGQRDLFRALQFLPGVSGSAESPADLFVRGGTPDQTLVTLDGFTLYQFDRVFGGLSAFNTGAIRKAELSKSTFSAADGGRLAGALRLTGESNATGKATGTVDVSMLGVGAVVSAPLGSRGSFLIASRRSPPAGLYNEVLDRFAGAGTVPSRERTARYSGGTFRSFPTSSFQDLNGKLELRLTGKDRVSISLYDGRDHFNNSRDLTVLGSSDSVHAVTDIDFPLDTVVQISDLRDWKARGLSGTWVRQWSPSASTTVSVGHSEFSRNGDQAWLLTSPSAGVDYSLAAGRGGSDALTESNRIEDTTVRVDNQVGLGSAHVLSFGTEIVSLDAEYALQSEVFRQSAIGGPRSSTLTRLLDRQDSGRLTTFYAQDLWRPAARLIVSPGVRVSRYGLASATLFEPRVNASFRLTSELSVKGGWAVDHQAAHRIVREDLMHGDGAFWALADGSDIPVARARQVVAGGSVEMRDVLFDIEMYYKTLDDLTLFAPRTYPGVAPVAGSVLLHHGSGTAQGLELFLQAKNAWSTFWASYTASRIEYTYPTLEASAFPASHDQKQELKAAYTARMGRWLALSAAWVIGSGLAYTPAETVEQVWFPTGVTVNRVTFAAKNSGRLPVYHRLDLSAERGFRYRGFQSTLGVTVFNVYDRYNVGYVDAQVAGSSLMTSDFTLMGRAVNVFARFGF